MKIVYLGDIESPHCYKMAKFFSNMGYEIISLTLVEPKLKFSEFKYRFVIKKNNYLLIACLKIVNHILARFPVFIHEHFKVLIHKLLGFYKIINNIKPDLIHAHYATTGGFLASKVKKIDYVLSCWGSDILVHPENNKTYHKIVADIVNKATIINTSCSQITQKLITDYNIPRDKIYEKQYGLDETIFEYAKEKSYNINNNMLRIISNRSAEKVYDNETLLKAACILQEKNIPVEIILISGGKLFHKYRKIINKNQLKNIQLLHRLPQQQMFEFLNNSDVYVTCSLSDGLSLSLLEALSFKLYPIVTNIPANTNIINEQNGSFFECKDYNRLAGLIIGILQDKKNINKIIEQNYNWTVENQSMNTNLLKLETNLYKIGRQ